MIIVDASVIIALLDSGDVHHERAVSLLQFHAGDGFLMHPSPSPKYSSERRGEGTAPND